MLFSKNVVSDGTITIYEYRDARLGGDINHFSRAFGLTFHQLENGLIQHIKMWSNLRIDGSLNCVNTGTNDNHVGKFFLSMGDQGVIFDPNGNGENRAAMAQVLAYSGGGPDGFYPSAAELASGQFSIVANYRMVGERPDGTQYPGNGSCNVDINVTHIFTPPDLVAPTISITEPSGTNPSDSSGSPVTSFKEVTDTSASITVSISDGGSGPKQFLYRINEYEFDGSSLIGPTSGSWETESGTSKAIPLTEEAVYEIEVKEAEDQKGNKSSGTEKSGKYIIINEEAAGDDAPTPVTVTPGCKDYWATGFPQDGIVTLDDLKTSPKVIDKIKEVYGMTDAEIAALWTWHTDMLALPNTDPMHASIAAKEKQTGNSSDAFASDVGALTGRSGGWFSGLYGRGHNGSSQYTATWLGRRSTGAPQPVLEHLSIYGEFWGYTQHGGWNTGIGGIRGRGTDRGGNVYVNMHRKRDQFIMDAVKAWASGSTFPTSSHASAAAYSGQPCGIDMFLAGLDIVPQGDGTFKIDDCIAPTIDELRVKSATVVAGNGKEYYVDYPNTGHVCHFEVEATDLEYGLKHAIFTPVIDSTPGSPSSPIPFVGNPQGTAIVEYDVDTQGHLEVYVDVEVFDMADNSSTETMSAKVISIDDAEPQGGGGWSGSGGTTHGSTTNLQTAGIRLENVPYMVGSKPYWNKKEVDFFIEYGDEYSGIDEAKFYINGTHEPSVILPQTATAILHAQIHKVTNGNLREGINNCQLWLKDLATNEWWSDSLDFYIDMTDPDAYLEFSTQYELRENNGKLWTKENNINVDLFYGDPGPDPSGIDAGATGVGSVPTTHNLTLPGSQLLNHNQGGLSVGQNDIYFTVKDKVEWEEDGAGSGAMTTDKITLYVDQTPPTGSIAMNSGQTINTVNSFRYVSTTGFNVDLTHDDSDSGLF